MNAGLSVALLMGMGWGPPPGEPLKDYSIRAMRPDHYRLPSASAEAPEYTSWPAGKLSLVARPDEAVPFGKGYRGLRVYVVNRSAEPLACLGYGNDLKFLVQEAQDEDGRWRPVEREGAFGFCGNAVCSPKLQPGQYWELAAPRYTGAFKTKLRFRPRLIFTSDVVYSNEFEGSVNREQFVPPDVR